MPVFLYAVQPAAGDSTEAGATAIVREGAARKRSGVLVLHGAATVKWPVIQCLNAIGGQGVVAVSGSTLTGAPGQSFCCASCGKARVAELVDAPDLGSGG